jgi:hypothetical protein
MPKIHVAQWQIDVQHKSISAHYISRCLLKLEWRSAHPRDRAVLRHPQYFPFLHSTLQTHCKIINVYETSLAERLLMQRSFMLKAPWHFTLHRVILMHLCEHLRRENNVSQYRRNRIAPVGSVNVTSPVLWLLWLE